MYIDIFPFLILLLKMNCHSLVKMKKKTKKQNKTGKWKLVFNNNLPRASLSTRITYSILGDSHHNIQIWQSISLPVIQQIQ